MRAKMLAVVLVGGLLACGVAWQATVNADLQAQPKTDPSLAARGDVEMETDCWHGWLSDAFFAKRVAGSYWVDGTHYCDFADPFPVRGVIALHQDRTVTWFTKGGQSAGLGAWERTGPLEVTLTSMISGDETGETVGRTRLFLEFGEDFQTATAEGCTDIYLDLAGDQNPLEDEPDLTCVFVDYTSIQRVNVLPCSEDD